MLRSRPLGVAPQAVHEQAHHPLAVFRICIGCWMTEKRDSGQKILGGDTGTDVAGTDIGTLDQAYVPPAIQFPSLRRRRAEQRVTA